VDITPAKLASYDCVAVLTDHSVFDYAYILEHAKLIVDTRGKYREPHEKVVKA
jgi:UDP-N-acetyl-D-glucosamine dehydrogenase